MKGFVGGFIFCWMGFWWGGVFFLREGWRDDGWMGWLGWGLVVLGLGRVHLLDYDIFLGSRSVNEGREGKGREEGVVWCGEGEWMRMYVRGQGGRWY